MSNRPVQVLSDSEIPSEIDTAKPSAFESDFVYTNIPEQTQSDTSRSKTFDVNKYHCVKTNGKIGKKPYNIQSQSEKIGNIIKRLDIQTEYDNNTNNDNEVLTRKQFATTITDMRNDILSMINLVGCLNSNYTTTETELKHIKKDLYRVIQENEHLKTKINELTSNNGTCNMSSNTRNEQVPKKIFKKLNTVNTESHNNKHIRQNKMSVITKKSLKQNKGHINNNHTDDFTASEQQHDRYEDTSKNTSDGKDYRMKRRFRQFDC